MIVATDVELRAGAQLLLSQASFRVGKGDRVGLVGRNGAGKTTLTKALAGETLPTNGSIHATGSVGYLPQDPRSGDPDELARDRILSARGLQDVLRRMQDASMAMDTKDDDERERIVARYARAEAEFEALGGYAVESQAASIAAVNSSGIFLSILRCSCKLFFLRFVPGADTLRLPAMYRRAQFLFSSLVVANPLCSHRLTYQIMSSRFSQ